MSPSVASVGDRCESASAQSGVWKPMPRTGARQPAGLLEAVAVDRARCRRRHRASSDTSRSKLPVTSICEVLRGDMVQKLAWSADLPPSTIATTLSSLWKGSGIVGAFTRARDHRSSSLRDAVHQVAPAAGARARSADREYRFRSPGTSGRNRARTGGSRGSTWSRA